MAEAPYDAVLQNFRLADGGPPGRRLALKAGRIAAILPADAPAPQPGQGLDLGGDLRYESDVFSRNSPPYSSDGFSVLMEGTAGHDFDCKLVDRACFRVPSRHRTTGAACHPPVMIESHDSFPREYLGSMALRDRCRG